MFLLHWNRVNKQVNKLAFI